MKLTWKQPLNGLLAGCAVLVGWWTYGWRGLVLALTVIAFWLLLEFNRTMRLMQNAAKRPMGHIDSVVMMQSKMTHGLNMQEVIRLAGSLGLKYGDQDDWQWTDPAGHQIVVSFRRGVVVRWAIARADEPEEEAAAPAQD
jgi:hypothetical protein